MTTNRVRFTQILTWEHFDEIASILDKSEVDILFAVHQPEGCEAKICLVEWDIAADLLPTNAIYALFEKKGR